MGFAKMQIFGRGLFVVSADSPGKTAMVFVLRAIVAEAAPTASKERRLKSPLEFKLSASLGGRQAVLYQS